MRTTGPVLAVGGITLANQVILNDKPMNWRIPVATGLAVGIFALLEKAWAGGAVALSWAMLASVLLMRVDPHTKSPIESLVDWLE